MSGSGAAHPRIFVSHSHHDNAWCRDFVGALQSAAADTWYDETGLGGGAEWVAMIQRELQARDTFLIVLTPEAWESRWVQEELNLAFATHRHILPVLHQPTTVEGFLLTRQWIRVERLSGTEAARKVAEVLGLRMPPNALASKAPTVAAPRTSAGVAPAPVPPESDPTVAVPTSLAKLGFLGRVSGKTQYILPPTRLVPAGAFLMGSDERRDKEAGDQELPQVTMTGPAYRIGTFPVTVAEYAYFVRAGQSEPPFWQRQSQHPDHPIVQVSWLDAVAYAAWLAKLTGQPWRLPTEAEWEKAARGSDGRIYPWGDTWDRTRANTSDGGPGTTTPVGSYPSGASPCGAQDMAGNVWEWTSSLVKPYPYTASDGREDPNATGSRVLRGGSGFEDPENARVAYRNCNDPHYWLPVGFRVVAA